MPVLKKNSTRSKIAKKRENSCRNYLINRTGRGNNRDRKRERERECIENKNTKKKKKR